MLMEVEIKLSRGRTVFEWMALHDSDANDSRLFICDFLKNFGTAPLFDPQGISRYESDINLFVLWKTWNINHFYDVATLWSWFAYAYAPKQCSQGTIMNCVYCCVSLPLIYVFIDILHILKFYRYWYDCVCGHWYGGYVFWLVCVCVLVLCVYILYLILFFMM